jgi:hypothetical protein
VSREYGFEAFWDSRASGSRTGRLLIATGGMENTQRRFRPGFLTAEIAESAEPEPMDASLRVSTEKKHAGFEKPVFPNLLKVSCLYSARSAVSAVELSGLCG